MTELTKSIRDITIARLKAEFGEPLSIGSDFRWSISLIEQGHAPINIAIDSWRTPETATVWVFNPSLEGMNRAVYKTVKAQFDLDELVADIHRQMHCKAAIATVSSTVLPLTVDGVRHRSGTLCTEQKNI